MVNVFEVPVRIYFQDTDAGGVVFHATYLHFMERARTEWLRARGFDAKELARRFQLLFIVRGLEIAYVAPARLDDMVMVSVSLLKIGRAQVTFAQNVRRGDEVLVRSVVNIASVTTDGLRPTAFPEEVRIALAAEAGNLSDEGLQGAATPPVSRLRLREKIRQS